MTNTDAFIYIIIGLLGVAYPILLQVIARLDEKYSSDNIVGLFDIELEGKVFRYSLYASLFFIFIWSLQLEPLFVFDGFEYFINNSARFFIALSTTILVIAFFFYVRKILIYYTPIKFINYLKDKHKKKDNDFKYFLALSDLLLLSIKNKQRNISITLSDFFYSAFKFERGKFQNEAVVYPDAFYDVVYKSIEELSILKEKRNYALEQRTAGGLWLLGEFEGKEISQKTYHWLWRNLLLVIRYEQDDMVMAHWENAHQYFDYCLDIIYDEYSNDGDDFRVINTEIVQKRQIERNKFVEFHYALGGLLTYKQRYDCLRRLFNHTNSEPPKYVLLPESMNEIFGFFFMISDPYDRKYPWISEFYSFPGLSGINSDYVIKRWICTYMAILFLRQYTLVPYLVTMKPLEFPNIPPSQSDIKSWIDSIDDFKDIVTKHLENKDLMRDLNFLYLTREWCIENDKIYPIDYFEKFKKLLEDAYKINALAIEISSFKVETFETRTRFIIEDTFSKLLMVKNQYEIEGETDKWYLKSQKMLYPKDAFSDNPEAHYIDYESTLSNSVAKDFFEGLSYTFDSKKSNAYLIKPEEIFKAIDKLEIDSNYIIVGFGFLVDFFKEQFNIPQLSSDKYRDTSIVSFPNTKFAKSSIFILNKKDLPSITSLDISKDVIEKYSLKSLSELLKLYASVIDMNLASSEILSENMHGKNEEDVKKSALLNVFVSIEVKWKSKIEMVKIEQYFDYQQKGIVNNLSEIGRIK